MPRNDEVVMREADNTVVIARFDFSLTEAISFANVDCFVLRNDEMVMLEADNTVIIARLDFSSTEAISFERVDCFVLRNDKEQKKDFIILTALRF